MNDDDDDPKPTWMGNVATCNFQHGRKGAEALERHTSELPPPQGGLAPVLLFPLERPAKRRANDWVEPLVADGEGA